ncbi:hypothetical protein [Psychroserpens sp.]|uniref:hypothetical protein n=1 Tax=Psychroserpens sp. TaxID=2020870 RepID=UPI00385AD58E
MTVLSRIFILLLITTWQVKAQVKEIYKESFDVENLMDLNLDLEGVHVVIVPSEDTKIHFDYSVEFENYSKKDMNKILEGIEASAQLNPNQIDIKAHSVNTLSDVSFSVETLFGITFEGDYISFKEPTSINFRKGKQYFMAINSSSRTKSLKEYLKNLREVDGKGKKIKISTKNVKILTTNFIIKLPQNLNLNIKATNSNMRFNLDLESRLSVTARNTSFKFQNITNSLNSFDIVNGNFRSNSLRGGSYKFDHVDDVQVAELQDVILNNEFTTTKIGEIGNNVEIIDFNSKFWVHNFSNGFTNFKMDTVYSEINLFFPEDMDYYIETFGHNTVHYYGDIITEIAPSRENQSSKMMVIGKDTSPNKILINTTHGIIRFGEDFIDTSN